MNTVTADLAREVYEGFKTRNEAAMVLSELSEIDVSIAFDMIEKAKQRHVLNLAVSYEQEQAEYEDNARHEWEYRVGAMR
jgi:hypothetical protein